MSAKNLTTEKPINPKKLIPKFYEIYLRINQITKKVYVGLTGDGIKKRWKNMCRKALNFSSNSYMSRSIRKYGPDCWEHKLLGTAENLYEAEQKEIKWIAHYKSNNREFGYNSTAGGGVAIFTPEVIAKISVSVSAHVNKPEEIERQRKIMIEHWKTHENPRKGAKASEETKSLMRQNQLEYLANNPNPFAGKIHSSESLEKISAASIKMWEKRDYKPMVEHHTEEAIAKMVSKKKGVSVNRKFFITPDELLKLCIELPSRAAVARQVGCTSANISILIDKYNLDDKIKLAKPEGTNRKHSEETKQRMREAKRKSRTNVLIQPDKLLELCKLLPSFKAVADFVGCTKENISLLVKSHNLMERIIEAHPENKRLKLKNPEKQEINLISTGSVVL